MEPGSEIYEPARYALRIWNFEASDAPLLLFQTSTPFPRYEIGDHISTSHWPLGQEYKLAVVERVVHTPWSLGDQVYFLQDVHCRFPLPIQDSRANPRA